MNKAVKFLYIELLKNKARPIDILMLKDAYDYNYKYRLKVRMLISRLMPTKDLFHYFEFDAMDLNNTAASNKLKKRCYWDDKW
jgi:hypothetical protein